MILRAELEGSLGRDDLEPLYLAVPGCSLNGAVSVDADATTLLLLRRALVVGQGARLQYAPVLPHCWE